MKVKIKDEFAKTIRHNGITYYFQDINDEKAQMIFNTNPELRFMFNELPVIDEKEFFKPEEQLKSIGIETPEEFEAVVKKAVKKRK